MNSFELLLESGHLDIIKVVDVSMIPSISLLRLKLTHYENVRILMRGILA